MLCGESVLSLGADTFSPSAGIASATSRPVAATHETTGRRRTAPITVVQKRECVWSVWRCGRSGILPRSILVPSSASKPGRTVTEPATAHATTAIVATARLLKTFVWIRNIAAIAMITVVPETITVRPDVFTVRSSASCGGRPRRRSSRERIT